MQGQSDIGLIGLAVMGENLVLNMESRGFTVSVYNRTADRITSFIQGRGKGKKFIPCTDLQSFCLSLKVPRKVFIMVKAGSPVDAVIEGLLPFLEKGDIVIDGGNSNFMDTQRRVDSLEKKGFLFVGCGVSGGEEGALKGPSMMPGGSKAAWPHIKDILQAIAAEVPGSATEKCCDWIGSGGAGHFVKMVHNGIEYGDIQLLSEAYHILKDLGGFSNDEIGKIMEEWNKGDLLSYLVEITADILQFKDDKTGNSMVDMILDTAEQKGTGKWTGQEALEKAIPVTMIVEAVFARCVSALKDQRLRASKILQGPDSTTKPAAGKKQDASFVATVGQAVFAAKIVSYAQGFALMRASSEQYNWNLNYGSLAMTWRNGCIIRSQFLGNIRQAFESNPKLENLMLDSYFAAKLAQSQQSWRVVVSQATMEGIPVPALGSALFYYDAYRCPRLPANLLQAQRDYFGAHTYERVDEPRGKYFHSNWTGEGGSTTSTAYST